MTNLLEMILLNPCLNKVSRATSNMQFHSPTNRDYLNFYTTIERELSEVLDVFNQDRLVADVVELKLQRLFRYIKDSPINNYLPPGGVENKYISSIIQEFTQRDYDQLLRTLSEYIDIVSGISNNIRDAEAHYYEFQPDRLPPRQYLSPNFRVDVLSPRGDDQIRSELDEAPAERSHEVYRSQRSARPPRPIDFSRAHIPASPLPLALPGPGVVVPDLVLYDASLQEAGREVVRRIRHQHPGQRIGFQDFVNYGGAVVAGIGLHYGTKGINSLYDYFTANKQAPADEVEPEAPDRLTSREIIPPGQLMLFNPYEHKPSIHKGLSGYRPRYQSKYVGDYKFPLGPHNYVEFDKFTRNNALKSLS